MTTRILRLGHRWEEGSALNKLNEHQLVRSFCTFSHFRSDRIFLFSLVFDKVMSVCCVGLVEVGRWH